MRISYRLVAFDRQTEELIGSHAVPQKFVSGIRKAARIPPADDGAGDYPLDTEQAQKIANKLGIAVHPETADYFIEPYLYDADGEKQTRARG